MFLSKINKINKIIINKLKTPNSVKILGKLLAASL